MSSRCRGSFPSETVALPGLFASPISGAVIAVLKIFNCEGLLALVTAGALRLS